MTSCPRGVGIKWGEVAARQRLCRVVEGNAWQGLPVFSGEVISAAMKSTGAKISEQIVRGRIALRDGSRALSSLLLLGLTRGCRVR
jgi:hypothetical protein